MQQSTRNGEDGVGDMNSTSLISPNKKKGSSGVPYEAEMRKIWTNASDSYTPFVYSSYGRAVKKDTTSYYDNKVSLWRWRDDFQNDFAARMDWCLNSYEDANHPPVPILSHEDEITVKSGEGFRLDAFKSTDPDGDHISFLWYPYLEAGTYKGNFNLGQPENAHKTYGKAPVVNQTETIHIILKVTDKGSPSLSRYKRINHHYCSKIEYILFPGYYRFTNPESPPYKVLAEVFIFCLYFYSTRHIV